MAALLSNLSVRQKLFLSYLMLFTIPLLMMFVLMYIVMLQHIHSNEKKTYDNLMTNVMQSMDKKLDELTMFGWQLSNTTWVKTIAYMQGDSIDYDRIDSMMLNEYKQQFVNYKTINNFLGEIALYFQGKNLVISSLGEQSLEEFERNIYHTRDLNLKPLLDGDTALLFSKIHISTYGQQRNGFLYMQKVPIYEQKKNVMLMFFINEQSFQELLSPLLITESAHVTLTDQSGKLIFESPAAADSSIKKENPFIFTSRPSKTGWTYSISVPKQVVTSEVNTLRIGILLLVCLSGIIGWLLSFRLASRGYRPLASLISLIQEKSGENRSVKQKNEFDWLQNKLQALFEQEEAVAERLRVQQPVIRDAYLKRLVEGSLEPTQQLFRALDLLDLKFSGPYFCSCLLYRCEVNSETVNRIISHGGLRNVTIHPVEYDGEAVLLCSYSDRKDMTSFLQETTSSIGEEAKKNITVAVGKEGEDLLALSISYQQARAAMEYRLFRPNQPLILFEEVDRNERSFYYPPDQEYQISNFIKSGDYEGAVALFDKIWSKNKEAHLSPAAFKNLLIDMELALLKIVEEKGLAKTIHVEPQTVLMMNDLDETERYFKAVYSEICRHFSAGLDLKSNELAEKIVSFVDTHFTDPSMSLTMLVERYRTSTSYLSRIFKEHTGINFLDYLSRKRMMMAKKLLLDDTADIKLISRKVGYDSDITFRRMFKKYEGITPSSFREIN